MKEITKKTITAYVVLIMIAALTSTIGLYIGNRIKNAENNSKIVTSSQYPDYDTIKGANPDQNIKRLDITDMCSKDGCVNNTSATIDFDGIDHLYKVTGSFSRAYLYINAQVDYSRLLTSWDDIYFKINDMGGHLVSGDDNSLPVPAGKTSQYLYNLSSISYYSSPANKVKKINENKNISLFSLLQDSAELHVHVTISSARPGRVMKEVSIYYECAQNSQCSIQKIK